MNDRPYLEIRIEGHAGSGKSALARMIANMLAVHDHRVLIHDNDGGKYPLVHTKRNSGSSENRLHIPANIVINTEIRGVRLKKKDRASFYLAEARHA